MVHQLHWQLVQSLCLYENPTSCQVHFSYPQHQRAFPSLCTLHDYKLRKELVLNQYVGEVISEAYVLEYGTDRLEMHVGAIEPGERALVIDDLVATGGTLSAAVRLLGQSE